MQLKYKMPSNLSTHFQQKCYLPLNFPQTFSYFVVKFFANPYDK